MQGKTISKIGNRIIQLFSREATTASKLVGFVKRKDQVKLTPQVFFKVLTLGCLSKTTISLEEMCNLFKQEGIKVSKQGLHQRFNSRATDFMKVLYEEALKRFKTEQLAVIDLLKPFSGVKILDSSTIPLPSGMKNIYRGCGGCGPEAALKLQVLLDYVKGHLDDITITDGRENDQSHKEHLEQTVQNALYLQDLGYFNMASFARLHTAGAYFISRHFNQTAIFDERGKRIDLAKFLRGSSPFCSKLVWIGKKDKLPIRMIIQSLPKTEVEKRIQSIREKARTHGKTPKKETLEMAKWSICITNIPESMLRDEQVYLIYSLRWQIELFFKLCKQESGIGKIKSKKSERILCEIYARLICVMMLLYMSSPVRWHNKKELSFPKAFCCLRKYAIELLKALLSPYRLKQFLIKFLSNLQDFAMKDIKRKKPATHQKLMSVAGQERLV